MENDISDLEQRTTAKGFLNYSKEYYDCYKLINNANPKLTKFFPVKYYLLCHSLELVLKALLRYYGANYNELRKYNHDFSKLLDALYKKHKIFINVGSHLDIDLVNNLYKNKEFEYHLGGAKSVPQLESLDKITHLFISKAIFKIIRNSDSQKLCNTS